MQVATAQPQRVNVLRQAMQYVRRPLHQLRANVLQPQRARHAPERGSRRGSREGGGGRGGRGGGNEGRRATVRVSAAQLELQQQRGQETFEARLNSRRTECGSKLARDTTQYRNS